MLKSTVEALRAVLRTDETITARDRARLLTLIRQGPDAAKPESSGPSAPRLVRRGEGAARLGVSLRTFDKITRELGLKRKWPGRVRSLGITEGDLNNLITGRQEGRAP